MKLINCLQQINQNSSEDILFVEEPWTIEANTQIITDERGQTVLNINGKKYTYFLDNCSKQDSYGWMENVVFIMLYHFKSFTSRNINVYRILKPIARMQSTNFGNSNNIFNDVS